MLNFLLSEKSLIIPSNRGPAALLSPSLFIHRRVYGCFCPLPVSLLDSKILSDILCLVPSTDWCSLNVESMDGWMDWQTNSLFGDFIKVTWV